MAGLRDRIPGFTLIELLVVISIIALLIGILLPVLGVAREAGRNSVCASNMRQQGIAFASYWTDNAGWFPGPHTSGAMWPPSVASVSPGDASSSRTPIQNMDWVSPTLGEQLGFSQEDIERARQIYDGKMRCPSNREVFNHFFAGSIPGYSPEQFPYASYAANLMLHAWPQREVAGLNPRIDTRYGLGGPGSGSGFEYPGYAPNIDSLTNASQKVLVLEGARSALPAGADFEISLNLSRYQIEGGGFMVAPPVIGNAWGNRRPYIFDQADGTWNGQMSTMTRRFAWRHANHSMNLLFADGHAEGRAVKETFYPELYLPTGTRLNGVAGLFYAPGYANGQVLK